MFLIHHKRELEEDLKKFGMSQVMLLANDSEARHAIMYSQSSFLDIPLKKIYAFDKKGELGYWRIANTHGVIREGNASWLNLEMKEIPNTYDNTKSKIPYLDYISTAVCCLVPGLKSISENIEAISIVDRFLEHSRVYIFHNNGDKKYFLSSADWMKRNLSRRVEIAFPIYDKEIQKQSQEMVDIQWNDNQKARIIDQKQTNAYKATTEEKKIRSPFEIYKLMK